MYEMSQVGNVIWGRKTIPEGRVAVHIKKLTMLPGILIVPKKKKLSHMFQVAYHKPQAWK